MTMHGQVPYYSRGTLLLMPYAEASSRSRYIHQKRPDFIVLLEEDRLDHPLSPTVAGRRNPGSGGPAHLSGPRRDDLRVAGTSYGYTLTSGIGTTNWPPQLRMCDI